MSNLSNQNITTPVSLPDSHTIPPLPQALMKWNTIGLTRPECLDYIWLKNDSGVILASVLSVYVEDVIFEVEIPNEGRVYWTEVSTRFKEWMRVPSDPLARDAERDAYWQARLEELYQEDLASYVRMEDAVHFLEKEIAKLEYEKILLNRQVQALREEVENVIVCHGMGWDMDGVFDRLKKFWATLEAKEGEQSHE